ncbi:MAG: MBOAT family protein [Kamptonema sp. SIO4C4]|nr:MBOAT family protein [Kamptonema sp. SIO4C4]
MTFLDSFYALFLIILTWLYWKHYKITNLCQNLLTKKSEDVEEIKPTQRKNSAFQLWLIVIGSFIFYALWQLYYIPLLIIITLFNFYLGRAMAAKGQKHTSSSSLSAQEWSTTQQVWSNRNGQILAFGITINVLLLLSFKYIPFILTTIGVVLNFSVASESAGWFEENLIAPLGISFFTFECIAYLIDVYRGAPATPNLLKFTSYKLFFPKLISGPITRFHTFDAQFRDNTRPYPEYFIQGLWLIACGAVKKALIADNLGIFVDLCYGNLERAGSGDLWLATLAYGLQLFFDFSGYVDIARGSAMFLGFTLPENFNAPYFTTSIASFWRRWHMTLGNWLRNYLYFPLGGSRQGITRTCLNLLLVMLIAGIWHGAAWGFIIWGGLHGLALVAHRLTDVYSKHNPKLAQWWQTIPGTVTAWFLTQAMIFLAWIFFRLPDVRQALYVFAHYFNKLGDAQFTQKVYVEALGVGRMELLALITLLVGAMGITYFGQRGLKLQLHWHFKLVLVPLCLFAVWVLAPEEGLRYIYFDF